MRSFAIDEPGSSVRALYATLLWPMTLRSPWRLFNCPHQKKGFHSSFYYKYIHSSVSMATSTVGKAEAKVEKAEDTEEGRVTRVADTGLLISSSNITLYTQYILLRSKHWATPHQRVLWINPVANISFPLITPEIAGFEFRSHYPLYSIYVHCRKGRKYCYGDSEGEYCHCDYCKCKHGYGLKVALFYFWLVYSTSWT